MQFWDQIINTALLGTDKRALSADELPASVGNAITTIQQGTTDKEEQFLQTAALAFNYRQCGVTPLQKEGISIATAGAEEKEYGPALAMLTLKDILDTESYSLLRYWLQQCASKQRIVVPELVPLLLNVGVQQKKLQNLIVACCGKRGEWLTRLNNEWNFSAAATDEELWQTGSPEQRKTVLQQLRQSNPAQAREWLQQTWPQEDANTKAEFLQLLTTNIGEDDMAFLESLSTEKSKKVKETALKLLKQIPTSAIVQKYQQVLQQAVTIKTEKKLLGISSEKHLHLQLPANIDESIYKTGIDKLSNTKELTDDEYVVLQLAQSVPPTFWEAHLQNTPGALIKSWQKDNTGKKIIRALINSIVTFKDNRWALAFMENSDVFFIDLIPLLPVAQQEFYSLKFIDQFADNIIDYAVQREDEWSVELTKAIFKYTAKNAYQFNKPFYSKNIHCIPVGMATELEKCGPPEAHMRSYWSSTSEHIAKLINLKIQTINSFNE